MAPVAYLSSFRWDDGSPHKPPYGDCGVSTLHPLFQVLPRVSAALFAHRRLLERWVNHVAHPEAELTMNSTWIFQGVSWLDYPTLPGFQTGHPENGGS